MKKTYQTPETRSTEIEHSNLCDATTKGPGFSGDPQDFNEDNRSKSNDWDDWDVEK